MRVLLILVIPLIFLSCAGSVVKNVPEGKEPETVKDVDIERYLGKWYEIARFDNSFEKGLINVTAEYSKMNKGKIRVLNSGSKEDDPTKRKTAKGRARVSKSGDTGKLQVSFFGPFWADYWIVGLDKEEYQWAIVGSPGRNYLWILSRTPEMEDKLYQEITEKAAIKGFPVEYLKMVPQGVGDIDY